MDVSPPGTATSTEVPAVVRETTPLRVKVARPETLRAVPAASVFCAWTPTPPAVPEVPETPNPPVGLVSVPATPERPFPVVCPSTPVPNADVPYTPYPKEDWPVTPAPPAASPSFTPITPVPLDPSLSPLTPVAPFSIVCRIGHRQQLSKRTSFRSMSCLRRVERPPPPPIRRRQVTRPPPGRRLLPFL